MIPILEKQLSQYLLDNYNSESVEQNKLFGVSDNTILKWLRSESNISGLNIDNMRAIYITNFYNKSGNTYKDKQNLSLYMRNSVTTQQRNYYKTALEKTKTGEDINTNCDAVEAQLEITNQKLNNIIEKTNQENNQELQDKIERQKYNKRKADVIRRFNKGLIKNIKKSTIDEYKLIYDENKKIYS
jgi:hypothetical protein